MAHGESRYLVSLPRNLQNKTCFHLVWKEKEKDLDVETGC